MQGRCDGLVSFAEVKRTRLMYLVVLHTVLEDVLDNQAARLTKGDLVPHAAKCFIHITHDLRGLINPAKLEQLLPDVTSVAMDDSFRDAAQ